MIIRGALLKLILAALSVQAVVCQINPDSSEGNTVSKDRNNDGFMRNLLRGVNLQRVQPNGSFGNSGLPNVGFNEPVPLNREPTILSEDPLAVLSNSGRFPSGSTNTQPRAAVNSSHPSPENLPPFQSSGMLSSSGESSINLGNLGAPDLSEFVPVDPSFNDLEIDPDSSVLGPAELKPVDPGNQITRRPGRRRRRRTTTTRTTSTTTTTTTPQPAPPQIHGHQQSDAIARTTSIIGGLLGSMLNGGRGVDPLTGALLQAISPGAATAATNPTQTLLGVLHPHNQNRQHNPDSRGNSNSNDALNNIAGQLLSGLTGGAGVGMVGVFPQQPRIFGPAIGMQPFGQPMQPFGRPMFGPVRHPQFPAFG